MCPPAHAQLPSAPVGHGCRQASAAAGSPVHGQPATCCVPTCPVSLAAAVACSVGPASSRLPVLADLHLGTGQGCLPWTACRMLLAAPPPVPAHRQPASCHGCRRAEQVETEQVGRQQHAAGYAWTASALAGSQVSTPSSTGKPATCAPRCTFTAHTQQTSTAHTHTHTQIPPHPLSHAAANGMPGRPGWKAWLMGCSCSKVLTCAPAFWQLP